MTTETMSMAATAADQAGDRVRDIYQEGIVAGLVGAGTIAAWFFILDVIAGRPFYTPTVLGTTFFSRHETLTQGLTVTFEMVLFFTFVHTLVFGVIGCGVAKLISWAESDPNYGFGIVLAFVIFEFGFTAVGLLLAQPLLEALTMPAILIGNLLAAATMGTYFWRRHRDLKMLP